jgi:hypothetical protein
MFSKGSKMRGFLTLCSAMVLFSTGSFAADLGREDASQSNWNARIGGAFDGYYVDQVDNDEGTDINDWNIGGNLDFALGGMVTDEFGVQLDVRGSLFADNSSGDEDDWTQSYLTGGLHVFTMTSGGLIGAFAGGGFAGDTGDTTKDQTYWFAGIEGQMSLDNSILFGEIGYLDGDDEFDEGINQAGFGRIGLRYFPDANWALMAAGSGAFGKQDNDDEPDSDALIGDIKLEAEYSFGTGSTSVFTSYEGTFVSFDGGDHSTDFHAVMLGFRLRLGSQDLKSAYSGPGSLELPSVDRWFAYTANEVE